MDDRRSDISEQRSASFESTRIEDGYPTVRNAGIETVS